MTVETKKTVTINIRGLQGAKELPEDMDAPAAVYSEFIEEAAAFIKDSGVDPNNVSSANESASTKALFKNRNTYKTYVNELNLPIGLYNPKGVNLKNQLDTWYEKPNYGKVDDYGSLTTLKAGAPLGNVSADLKLVDFAAAAFNDLLVMYNEKRRSDPRSILNQIKATRAYEPVPSYFEYLVDNNSLYDDFYDKVLRPNRYNSKIKNYNDFYNLFFAYIRNNGLFFTEPAYYESSHNSIYASGLVVDIIHGDIGSDNFRSKVISDVRFPVLNYVAKMHGFRIDPNNPWRLIADLSSDIMIEKYMRPALKGALSLTGVGLTVETYKQYYEDVYGVKNLALFAQTLVRMYEKFISKHPAYSSYEADTNLKQLFQKEFKSMQNLRPSVGVYIDYYFNWLMPPDQTTLFPKKMLTDQYVDFRIMETGVRMPVSQRSYLKEKFYSLLQVPNYAAVQSSAGSSFKVNPATKRVELLNREAFYFLERSLGLPSSRGKKHLTSSPKSYIFVFGKGNPLFTP
tara:strand:- start:7100 stop:8638 length:1539 start_codon:yes stop_codon:yes gene_type:complete